MTDATTTTSAPDVHPLGYDTRPADPWLAVIRFALLLGAVWGTLLVLEFAGFYLDTRGRRSMVAAQFMLGAQSAIHAGGMCGCLLFGALLLVSALECLKLRRRARKTFVVCVFGGFASMVAVDILQWYQVAHLWWYAITGSGRSPPIGWTISAIIKPVHLTIIPAALVYLMTRKSVKQRFD